MDAAYTREEGEHLGAVMFYLLIATGAARVPCQRSCMVA